MSLIIPANYVMNKVNNVIIIMCCDIRVSSRDWYNVFSPELVFNF